MPGLHASREPPPDLIRGESAIREELLYERVISFRGALDELLAGAFDLLLRGLGNRGFLPADICLLVDEVNDALEIRARADGDDHGNKRRLELVREVRNAAGEVRALLFHLVHDDKPRQGQGGEAPPELDGLYLDTHVGANQERGAFSHAESSADFSDEVGGARGVQNVDLAVFPGDVSHGHVDGDLPGDLFLGEVAHRLSGFDFLRLGDHAAGDEQLLDQGSLARAAVTGEGDVSQ